MQPFWQTSLADIDVSKTWGGKVFDAVLPLLAVTSNDGQRPSLP
ncbi:hypothetical protein [Stenotrophomonas lacuserhaii]|nr:hypothetical protein [Stenotrophomonas pennii]